MTPLTAPRPEAKPAASPRGLRLSTIRAVVRNPIEALPAQVFTEPLVHMRAAGVDRLYLMDPVLIHEALVKRAEHLIKSIDARRTLGPALGQGLLTAEGAHWRWQHRSAAPVFQHQRLLALAPAMIAAAERTRDRWLRHASAEASAEPLKIGGEMMRTTFDIIAETMLSGRDDMDVEHVERAVTDYLAPTGWVLAFSLMRLPVWTPYPGRTRARAAARYLRTTLTAMVARRRAAEPQRDLLALLLAATDPDGGRAMSDAEVVDNLMTFVMAGHETTAIGLAWTLHLLARHPDVETRVVNEIDAVTRGAAVQPEQIAELVYTRQVFSEAMRLFPPAPIISREVVEGFSLGERAVRVGTIINIPIFAVHRHRALWNDPERFDPDRFAPSATAGRARHAYMPFGAGPRICIGSAFAMMEAVAILAVLLQRLRLRDAATAPSAPTMRVTLRPVPDLQMRVEPR